MCLVGIDPYTGTFRCVVHTRCYVPIGVVFVRRSVCLYDTILSSARRKVPLRESIAGSVVFCRTCLLCSLRLLLAMRQWVCTCVFVCPSRLQGVCVRSFSVPHTVRTLRSAGHALPRLR